MNAPVDVRRNLHMAYQHIVICGPDETVQAALIAVEDAVADLIEAQRKALAWWGEHKDDTTGDWRSGERSVYVDEPEFVTAARTALARVGSASHD